MTRRRSEGTDGRFGKLARDRIFERLDRVRALRLTDPGHPDVPVDDARKANLALIINDEPRSPANDRLDVIGSPHPDSTLSGSAGSRSGASVGDSGSSRGTGSSSGSTVYVRSGSPMSTTPSLLGRSTVAVSARRLPRSYPPVGGSRLESRRRTERASEALHGRSALCLWAQRRLHV
jgi:hypothetical protein